jgi:hypothetical protein
MAKTLRPSLWMRLAALTVLAAALGYIEASIVVYLREVIVPVRQLHYPDAAREVLPLLTLAQLTDAGPEVARLLNLERVRELAAVIVLAAMALGLRRRRGEGLAFFMIGFAVWDILYYVFLKVLIGWPASPATWDVLYLVPIPWVAPVWAPVAVSLTLLIAGLVALARRRGEISAAAKLIASLTALAGVALILVSFMLRVRQAVGGVPEGFDWPWFLAGWLLGAAGLFWLTARPSTRGR